MTPSTTVQAFAYAALTQANDDQDAAIAALKALNAGLYTAAATGGGRVMTAATATNKSFQFTLPQDLSPKQLGEFIFQALQLLKTHTAAELEALMFRRRRNVSVAGFGYPCR